MRARRTLRLDTAALTIVTTAFFYFTGCSSDDRITTNQSSDGELRRREVIGERLYQRYCSGCHGETGEGDGLHSYTLNPSPANHTNSSYMSALSNVYLFTVVSEGGLSTGKSVEMPGWKDVLNKNEIGNVILYVRTLSEQKRQSEK